MKKPKIKVKTDAEAFKDEEETGAVGKFPVNTPKSKDAAVKGNLAKGGKKKKKKMKSIADLRAKAKEMGV